MGTDLFEIVANYTYDWESWLLPDGRVRWINPAVERMTGFSVAECLSMVDYPLEIVHPDDREAVRALLQSALGGTSGNDVEFRILRKDGQAGCAAVSWQPMVGPDGERLGVRASVRDISWRKSAEDALRLAKVDAEKADRAKSRFLAAASHDLRQPLQAVSMYVAALSRQSMDESSKEILADIRTCLDAGNELLEDLLDISRLDAGVVVPEFADVPIPDLFELLEKSFQREAQDRKLHLRFVPRSIFVRADHRILTRIVQNLVANALRYTEQGRVLVGCRVRGGNAVIEVWDSGIGIAPEYQDKIFEEFYQLHNPARDRRRGAGLGLAIVRRKAALIGAPIALKSEPGKGSVFSISLPIAHSHQAVAPVAEDVPLDLTGRTIAVIDDEPHQLNALETLLRACGGQVISANTIDDLVTRVAASDVAPELAIADYRLEAGAKGSDAIAAVRFKVNRAIPGILVTGDTDPGRIAEAEASGCRLVHKPVEGMSLVRTINQLLSGVSTAA
ncbi:PAS domain-containing hybrid sensor histidine kinase/response regulator [Methyloceanibacter caenitepidi]|uniref:histidine kinase n=1 Tax=Methyloceanibacter caenitepidi TaxID=1384459 RepID=A0A0A8K9C5_9HYPH|nr:ATP-binding protein [Methyloceanibacter caenitepidi]BAQ18679.1 two-component hybrid sensor and regulator [Methyloceanibacter caenitepidi]